DALASVDLRLDGWAAGAVALFALAVVLSGVLWGAMISGLGRITVGLAEAIRVHCLSWLLKSISGQVGSVVDKLTRAHTRGVPKSLTALSFFYESAFLVIGSIVPTGVLVLALGGLDLGEGGMVLQTA